MARDVNKSNFGHTNWEPVKEDFSSVKIKSKDRMGNVHYIEVFLKS